MNIEFLAWDSDFFQLKIGKIIIDVFEKESIYSVLDELKIEKYQLIYIFSTNEINEFTDFLLDKKVIYEYKITENQENTAENIVFLEKKEKYSAELLDLALQSGEYSRFRLDKRFPKGSFEKLYALWIENSLNKKIADDVIVYEENDLALGMVTLKQALDCSIIGLIAVQETTRGKKIGTHLLNAVKNKTREMGRKSVEVATQLDNKSACYFYEKNNFSIKKIEYIYHIWL